MEPLWRLAVRHGIAIVEDAAQAIGATYRGRQAGVLGTIACFSFFPTKNLGGFGDGGAVLCRDAELAARLRVLRDHGASPPGLHHVVGVNSRLDALQAAVLGAKLPHLDAWTSARQANAAAYHERFGAAGAGLGPGGFAGLALPLRLPEVPAHPAAHVFHHYVVRVPAGERDRLRAELARDGVETGVYYATPLHRQPCYAGQPDVPAALPGSEAAACESVALPVHAELAKEQLAHVVECVRRALAG
jgi:dTDP-4-amino-4,6-dideoxygalactose transaminase